MDLNWAVDDRSGECLGPAGGKSAALGCFRVLWGWDPAPLGRDRTVSSGTRPMPAPTAAPAPKAIPLCEPFGLWPYSPHPPLWHHSVRTTRASPPVERDMCTGPVSLADVFPGPGVCPVRCLVVSGRASVVHHLSTGPHRVAGSNEFLSEFRRVGARESWTRGWCNVGPPLALGLRGAMCPRPVCGPLGPSGGPMPLRFLWGHAGAGGHRSSSGHVPAATPTPGPPRFGPNCW